MPKSNVFKKGAGGDVEFNMTPMIDCTFQLIIFFILASSVLSPTLAELELHRPTMSVAKEEKDDKIVRDRVVVNVISAAGQNAEAPLVTQVKALEYKIMGKSIDIGDVATLVKTFEEHKKQAEKDKLDLEKFRVEIRSDKRVSYRAIKPVMQAAGKAGVKLLDLTALVDPNAI